MKACFGTDLSGYSRQQLLGVTAAVSYELTLCRLYIVWNLIFMFAGLTFVYLNLNRLVTNEMLLILAAFWGVSGLPFFIRTDLVKNKFMASLPGCGLGKASAPIMLIKIIGGFAVGAWATHVMLIAALAKNFELAGYLKQLKSA